MKKKYLYIIATALIVFAALLFVNGIHITQAIKIPLPGDPPLPPPADINPKITSFFGSPNPVSSGTPFTIQWNVSSMASTNGDRQITLSGPGGTVLFTRSCLAGSPLNCSTGSYTVNSGILANAVYALDATNNSGDGEAIRAWTEAVTGPSTITSIAVTCASPTVQAGQTDQCWATVNGTGNYSSAVTWSASAGTISNASSGLFTAPAMAGPVTITATSVQDNTKSSPPATVTVNTSSGTCYDVVTTPCSQTSYSAGQVPGIFCAAGNQTGYYSRSCTPVPGLCQPWLRSGGDRNNPFDYACAWDPGLDSNQVTCYAVSSSLCGALPPTVTLTANPTSLTIGSPATLSWATSDATACTASSNDGSWSGAVAISSAGIAVTPAAVGTTIYTLNCTGPGGSDSDSQNIAVAAALPPPTATGTINVFSRNSVVKTAPVTASWYFPAYPDAADDPCTSHGGSCTNVSQGTYNNMALGTYAAWPIPGSAGAGYAVRSVERVPIAEAPQNWLDRLISTAKAVFFDPGTPAIQSLASGNLTASFIIYWDPIAAISVSPSALTLTDAAPVGTVTVKNSGADGSTLTWNSSVSPASAAAWLSVTPSSDSSGLTGGAQDTVTIKADATGLTNGTYTATVNLTGTSAPGCPAAGCNSLTASFNVTFTVTGNGGGGPSPTASVTVNPTSIVLGQSTNVTWTTTNAASCTAVGSWAGTAIATSGAMMETPAAIGTATYGVNCTGTSGGNASDSKTVNVAPSNAQCTLVAVPPSVVPPQQSTLVWNCSNPIPPCYLTGVSGPVNDASGSVVVTPTQNTIYTLSCPQTQIQASTTVTVGGPGIHETNP